MRNYKEREGINYTGTGTERGRDVWLVHKIKVVQKIILILSIAGLACCLGQHFFLRKNN